MCALNFIYDTHDSVIKTFDKRAAVMRLSSLYKASPAVISNSA